IPTNSPKNDFTLKVPTMEGIHLLYLEINKIFSLSCQPICNSAIILIFKERGYTRLEIGQLLEGQL
ncbi:hypothetical protein ACLIL3_014325, partial [Acinetobacter radioresistens]